MPRTEAARVLREARDLMNTNGRHWLKGDMELYIDESIIENREGYRISPKAQVGDVAYCAWGGIKEVADSFELQVEAMEALVQIIDPVSWNDYLGFLEEEKLEYKDELENDLAYTQEQYPTFLDFWNGRIDSREEQLGEIIANWNDDDKRTWEDVRASLTKAAANLKRKPVNVTTT